MPGTTPKFGWPFPTGSDRVMDGDNAIEALARGIETTFEGIRPTGRIASADVTLTTTNQLVPGTGMPSPITPTLSEVWFVIYATFFHATTMGFGDCTAELFVNGAAIGPAVPGVNYSPPAVPDRLTVTGTALFLVGAGVPTSLEIRSKCTVAGGVVKARAGSQFTLLRFPVNPTLRDEELGELPVIE